MSIKITQVKKDDKECIKVDTPYHPDFPQHAKNLGGKWEKGARAWYFDTRDEASVRDLCLDLFGTDGSEEPELVDVQVKLTGTSSQTIWFAGRKIAKRSGRDSPVRLGENVVLIDGSFTARGGSVRYPVVLNHGTSVTLEVRDVPLSLALREKENDPENVTILSDKLVIEPITVTISGEAANALRALGDDYATIIEAMLLNAD